MNFFKKLFGDNITAGSVFPPENDRGQVEIEGGRVVFKAVNYYDSEGSVEIDKIDRAYATVNENKEASIVA